MTFLLGVTLSDCVCLAADTRVTVRDAAGETVTRDNCLKIEHLNRRIAVATAGHVGLVQRLLAAIRASVTLTTDDPVTLRDMLVHLVTPEVDYHLQTHDYAESRCCLLFAGLTADQPTPITADGLTAAMGAFLLERGRQQERATERLLDPHETKKALWLSILQRPGPFQSARVLAAFADLAKLPAPSMPLPGATLFALEVRPPAGPRIVQAGWGEILAYGDHLTQQERDATFTELEFSERDGVAIALRLTAVVALAAEQHPSVGGGVVGSFLAPAGLVFILGPLWKDHVPEEGGTLVTYLDRAPDGPPPHNLVMRLGAAASPLYPVAAWSEPGCAVLAI